TSSRSRTSSWSISATTTTSSSSRSRTTTSEPRAGGGHKKSDPRVAFLMPRNAIGAAGELPARSGSHRLDGGRQAALVTGSLVLVNDLLVRDAVDGAHRGAKDRLSRRLVATRDGLANGLDRGTQAGAEAGVVSANLDCLTGALASLCRVGHRLDSVWWFLKTRDFIRAPGRMQASRVSPRDPTQAGFYLTTP